MARVTDAEVKDIIDTSLTTTVFITAANLIVDEHLKGKDLSETELKEIERWLAAHFVAVRDKRAQSETVGSAHVSYANAYDMGLDFTEYGQMAKVLDGSGTLAKLGQKVAGFTMISETD